jgi:ketosteroid isomerase-like protein
MASNRELIRSLYDAFAKGDAGTVLGAMHPEVNWREAENSPYADQNPYVGPGRVGEGLFGRLMADFDGFAVTPHKLVAEGDAVVALGRCTGSYRTTGNRLDAQFVHAWTVRDGKVVDFQDYTDTAQWQKVMTA